MKITNNKNLPTALVNFARSDYEYTPNRYSVTTLLNGATETVLKYRHNNDIEKDVSDLIWALFGSAFHKILEEQDVEKHESKEEKLQVDFNGSVISGIYDLYNSKTQTVTDYKTTSVWKWILKDFDNYRQQGLIYAWMLNKLGFKCDKAEFILFFKDHSKTKAKVERDYPDLPVEKKIFKFTQKDFDEIEVFLRDKLNKIKMYEKLSDDELPPCSDEERWYKGTKYAVKKKGNKRAIKLYDNKDEAEKRASKDDNLIIEERIGRNVKCEEYCDVKDFCPFYKKHYKNGGAGELPF